jgi:F0F1-type ATP synthase assembly protein I
MENEENKNAISDVKKDSAEENNKENQQENEKQEESQATSVAGFHLSDLDKFIPPILTYAGIIVFISSVIGAIYLYLIAEGPLASYYIASAISSIIVGIILWAICRALAIIVEKLQEK